MTDEELQEEQRRDFETRRDLAFKQLVCALNEGDAEIFDIEVEKNKEGEDVAWIYFRDGGFARVNICGDTIITAIREILNCKRLKECEDIMNEYERQRKLNDMLFVVCLLNLAAAAVNVFIIICK